MLSYRQLALSIGMTALVDFRLLGRSLRDETPAEIAGSGLWWMLGGLIVAVFSGFLIFTTGPDMYYLNWVFDVKMVCLVMVCLVLAIVFNYAAPDGKEIVKPSGVRNTAMAI